MSQVVAMAPITIGDLVLGTLDDAGADIQWDDIQGWISGPGVKLDLVPRAGGGGSHDASPTLDVRVVSITGWIRGVDRAATARAVQAVKTAGTRRHIQQLTVDDPDLGTLSTWVRPSAEPQIVWDVPCYATWQLIFTAPDPVLYGPEQVHLLSFPTPVEGDGLQYPLTYPLDYGDAAAQAQQVFIPNAGTEPLWLRLRVDGPVTRPRLYVAETGAQLLLDLTVAAGSWVDVLTRDRRVLAGGVAPRRWAATYLRDWLAVPPGGATVGWDADVQDPDARLWIWAPSGAWL
jgi:hypothetical protein